MDYIVMHWKLLNCPYNKRKLLPWGKENYDFSFHRDHSVNQGVSMGHVS